MRGKPQAFTNEQKVAIANLKHALSIAQDLIMQDQRRTSLAERFTRDALNGYINEVIREGWNANIFDHGT